jgi:hypothetical protein
VGSTRTGAMVLTVCLGVHSVNRRTTHCMRTRLILGVAGFFDLRNSKALS